MIGDILVMISSFGLGLALLPSVLGRDKPERVTCLFSAALLTLLVLGLAISRLWLSVGASAFTTLLWFVLYFQPRRDLPPSVEIREVLPKNVEVGMSTLGAVLDASNEGEITDVQTLHMVVKQVFDRYFWEAYNDSTLCRRQRAEVSNQLPEGPGG